MNNNNLKLHLQTRSTVAMGNQVVASRVFTITDQLEFARLSGDYNPIHLDEIIARRTQAGAPVVHGIHAVIWALDALAAQGLPIERVINLNVQFAKFMYLDTPIELRLVLRTETVLKIELSIQGLRALILAARLAAQRPPAKVEIPTDTAEITTEGTKPNEPVIEELATLAGWLTQPAAGREWARLYPHAVEALTARRLDGLAQLSRLVGMISPGLHSIFTRFVVDLVDGTPERPGMGFRTTSADPGFRLVKMNVAGSGLSGNVSTLMRWPQIDSPTMDALANHLTPGEFSGSNVLIIGASRGLGAITAKLLAAGGGRVIVTYVRGKDDAEKLADEINGARGTGTCTTFALDARGDVAAQLAALTDEISHLYYFATPKIFHQKKEVFSAALFEDFSRVYLNGFSEAIQFLRARPRLAELAVFYPSSVAVEARPAGMTEYSMAKIAGEFLCIDLMQAFPEIKILINRLPRLLTDQTATVIPINNADPLEVMLPLIRQVQSLVPAIS